MARLCCDTAATTSIGSDARSSMLRSRLLHRAQTASAGSGCRRARLWVCRIRVRSPARTAGYRPRPRGRGEAPREESSAPAALFSSVSVVSRSSGATVRASSPSEAKPAGELRPQRPGRSRAGGSEARTPAPHGPATRQTRARGRTAGSSHWSSSMATTTGPLAANPRTNCRIARGSAVGVRRRRRALPSSDSAANRACRCGSGRSAASSTNRSIEQVAEPSERQRRIRLARRGLKHPVAVPLCRRDRRSPQSRLTDPRGSLERKPVGPSGRESSIRSICARSASRPNIGPNRCPAPLERGL